MSFDKVERRPAGRKGRNATLVGPFCDNSPSTPFVVSQTLQCAELRVTSFL
jgi:hypothetical protein